MLEFAAARPASADAMPHAASFAMPPCRVIDDDKLMMIAMMTPPPIDCHTR